jgi:hypothetical protein
MLWNRLGGHLTVIPDELKPKTLTQEKFHATTRKNNPSDLLEIKANVHAQMKEYA